MPRYIFDVHDDGPVEWGDTSYPFTDHSEIEVYVRQLIQEARHRQGIRGEGESLVTVFVHQESGGIVLTAYGRPGADVQLIWTPSGERPVGPRIHHSPTR